MSAMTRTNHGSTIPLPDVDRCELCGLRIDRADPDGHGLGECVEVCAVCDGAGTIAEPHYGYVSQEMASDAGEPSMEGEPIQTGTEDVPCFNCNGLGGIPFQANVR